MKTLITIVLFISGALCAYAYEVDLGVAGGVGQSPYRGEGVDGLPLPYVGFDSKYIYIKAPGVGVHAYNNEFFSVDVELFWMFQEYKSKDNDHRDMRKLDNRYSTLGAAINTSLNTKYGDFETSATADLLGKNEGFIITAKYSYPIYLSQRFIISPHVGANWTSTTFNNYYYSVSHRESAKSGISPYRTDDSFTPFCGLSAVYVFTPKLKMMIAGNYTFLPSEVKDSPMVDKSGLWSAFGGIIYTFD